MGWNEANKSTIITTNTYNFLPQQRMYFWFEPIEETLFSLSTKTSRSQVMNKTVAPIITMVLV